MMWDRCLWWPSLSRTADDQWFNDVGHDVQELGFHAEVDT